MGGELTIGGISLILLGLMTWVIKRLFKERANDFQHIKKALETLPCKTHAEQLRQHEKRLNGQTEGGG